MAREKNKNILIVIAVVGLLIFLHFIKILQPIEYFAGNALKPFLGGFYSLGANVRNYFQEQSDRNELNKLNKELQDEAARLTADNSKLKLLEEENQTLRQYLNFMGKKEYKYVLGNVISRTEPTIANQKIMIDKGSKDGLAPGMLAIGSFGAVIGKVGDVKDGLAEINLVTNPNCKMAATIQNFNKTAGITEGDLGLTIKMNFIPQTEKIKIGDTIITSGLESSIPRGFTVGKIAKVVQENNELWQGAVIEPLVELNKLVIVSIILPVLK